MTDMIINMNKKATKFTFIEINLPNQLIKN